MILLGVIQTIIGFLIFIFRKPRNNSNTILAIWLLVLAFVLSGGLVEGGVVQYFKPGVFPLVFLFGPLLYFYIQSQIFPSFRFQYKHFFHLIPFFAVVIHRSFTQPKNIGFIEAGSQNFNNAVYLVLMVFSIIVYWILGIILLLKHQKNIPDNFSYHSERITLNWTWIIVLLTIVIFMISFVTPFYRGKYAFVTSDVLFYFNFVLFSFLLIVFGLIQPAIFSEKGAEKSKNSSTKKYNRSGLNKNDLEQIALVVNDYLKQEEPWLNPEFDLQKMATELNLTRQKLSQVINEELHKNFYRLINEYRVENVKQKILSEKFSHLSLLGIALESGFNSKASFNRVFKEITGVTPTQFKSSV